MRCCIGVDVGTSGVRAAAVDVRTGKLIHAAAVPYARQREKEASAWVDAVCEAVTALPEEARRDARGICVDGTSATAVLVRSACDPEGARIDTGATRDIGGRRVGSLVNFECCCQPMMYNDAPSADSMRNVHETLDALGCPADHTVRAPTSTLSKLLHWYDEGLIVSDEDDSAHTPLTCKDGSNAFGTAEKKAEYEEAHPQPRLAHQVDVINHALTAEWFTDENNALKLGYDPGPDMRCFPSWLRDSKVAAALPCRVVEPGEAVARVREEASDVLGIGRDCVVVGGTTDSIAAFLAAGATEAGEAVTSLGSTLAIKIISTRRIESAAHGVYSHRLLGKWLVGGASNTGGAILRKFFDDEQLKVLSDQIDPNVPSPLEYYPLLRPGERFPIADAGLEPRLEPRPHDDDAAFLHGILESIARIEAMAFVKLRELGCDPPVQKIKTCGGGAKNRTWTQIRERLIQVPVEEAANVDAAVGAAQLARRAITGVAT